MKSLVGALFVFTFSLGLFGSEELDRPMLRKEFHQLTYNCTQQAMTEILQQVKNSNCTMTAKDYGYLQEDDFSLFTYNYYARCGIGKFQMVQISNVENTTLFVGYVPNDSGDLMPFFRLMLGKDQKIPFLKYKDAWVEAGYDDYGNRDLKLDKIQKFVLETPANHGESVHLVNRDTGAPSIISLNTKLIESCLKASNPNN